jgi:siroheme synthase
MVVDASMPTQAVWSGTLDDLAAEQFELENLGPATIVIGEVVALATLVGHGREKREHHGSR